MTQPIFFKDVPNLPADKRFYVNGVTTTNGRGYTKTITKGITAASWNTANQTLSLTLENASGSLVDLRMPTSRFPQQIMVNGASVPSANSLAAYEAATGSIRYLDNAGNSILYLKVKHTSGTATVSGFFYDFAIYLHADKYVYRDNAADLNPHRDENLHSYGD